MEEGAEGKLLERRNQCSLVLFRTADRGGGEVSALLVETRGATATKNTDLRVCVPGTIDSWRKFKGTRVRKPSARSAYHHHGTLSDWPRASFGACQWPVLCGEGNLQDNARQAEVRMSELRIKR